jgi:4-oxalocrotonate tautomerase family enzyme
MDIGVGRSAGQIRALHEQVATVVADILETDLGRVRTIIREIEPEHWGIGGVPLSEGRRPEATEAPNGSVT